MGGIFDDEVDLDFFEGEMRRYYSNIVGKYGATVQNALKKAFFFKKSATSAPVMGPSGERICKRLFPYMTNGANMKLKKG